MIHPSIEPSQAQEANPQRHAKPGADASSAGKSFAAVLHGEKRAISKQTLARPHKTAKIDVPDGETWRPVRGDDNYARIMSGPRKGLYINLSHGARRGETFRVEHRHGERVHVYGEGDHEKVVLAAKDSGKVHGRHEHRRGEEVKNARRGRNETWAPVEGHSDYADILSGPRNGYYINTSGGERDGMVFHIVHRHGREYHIYGKGKDRQVVLVRHSGDHHKPDKADKPDKARDARTGGAKPS